MLFTSKTFSSQPENTPNHFLIFFLFRNIVFGGGVMYNKVSAAAGNLSSREKDEDQDLKMAIELSRSNSFPLNY